MSSPAPTPVATDAVTTAVNQISTQVTQYAPAVIVGVQAAEQSSASGADKKAAVLNGILQGAKVGETIPVPQVASISALIDLTVSILNALGIFKSKSTTTSN